MKGVKGILAMLRRLTPRFAAVAVCVAVVALQELAGGPASQAQGPSPTVYNAFADFSPTSNPGPGGIWSYGYTPVLAGTFSLHTEHTVEFGWLDEWWHPEWPFAQPTAGKNISGADQIYLDGTTLFPGSDFLHVHPGCSGQFSVVRWTAPVAGTYQISASFEGLHINLGWNAPTTTDVHVLHNGTPLFNAEVDTFIEAGTQDFTTPLTLSAGDTIDFAVGVGSNGNCYGDSTGVKATIEVLDNVPPTTNISLSGTAGSNGWYRSDVQVTLTATDNPGGSGVSSTEYSLEGTTWNTYTGPFTISAEGTTTVWYHSTDNASNVEATKTETVKIDKTAPSITINVPAANADYLLHAVVTASYTATDTISGVDSVSGTVPSGSPIDTGSIGPKTFTATATDKAGNVASHTISYDVIYGVSALYDQDKAWKAGAAVPIKIQLVDANGVNQSAGAIAVRAIALAPEGTPKSVGKSNPGNLLRYAPDLGGYVYTLSAEGLQPGTWALMLSVDGVAKPSYKATFSIK